MSQAQAIDQQKKRSKLGEEAREGNKRAMESAFNERTNEEENIYKSPSITVKQMQDFVTKKIFRMYVASGRLVYDKKTKKYYDTQTKKTASLRQWYKVFSSTKGKNGELINQLIVKIFEIRKANQDIDRANDSILSTNREIIVQERIIKENEKKAIEERKILRKAENKLNMNSISDTFKAANDAIGRKNQIAISELEAEGSLVGNVFSAKSSALLSDRTSRETIVGRAADQYFKFAQNEAMRKQRQRENERLVGTLQTQGNLTRDNANANTELLTNMLGDMDQNQSDRFNQGEVNADKRARAQIEANARNFNMLNDNNNKRAQAQINAMNANGRAVVKAINDGTQALGNKLNDIQALQAQTIDAINALNAQLRQFIDELPDFLQQLVNPETGLPKGDNPQPPPDCLRKHPNCSGGGQGRGLNRWEWYGPDQPERPAPYWFWRCAGMTHMLSFPGCVQYDIVQYFRRPTVQSLTINDMQMQGGKKIVPPGTERQKVSFAACKRSNPDFPDYDDEWQPR